MKLDIIGGGPAGLYFSVLAKKSFPQAEVAVTERNRADDTFGFGIVLSDETLNKLRAADAPSYRDIAASFAYWDDIYTHYRGRVLKSSGHGFSGIKRLALLQILQRRAAALGVNIQYETEDAGVEAHRDADLIVAADGINSRVRESLARHFRPEVDLRSNKFVWLGAHMRLPGFTYSFRENECGIWNLHAYMYAEGECTLVVETTDAAFRRSGLRIEDEQATAAYVERLFAEELRGADGRAAKVLTNRSHWRNFPTIACASWHHGNVVLLGDAAHTAHFTIGSGTKLAMEDARSLVAVLNSAEGDVPTRLARYQAEREIEALKLQSAARNRMTWFEEVDRYVGMEPEQFAFAVLTGSQRVGHANQKLRDQAYTDDFDRWFAARCGLPTSSGAAPVPPMFTPFSLRGMTLSNRVVVSPMCMYSAEDGMPTDFHLVHYGSRGMGGAALMVTEMTCVAADARITPGCTGIWNEAQQQAWRRIVDFIHANGETKVSLQIGHAGRKGSTRLAWDAIDQPLQSGNWPLLAPSPLPYLPGISQTPRAMDRADMNRIKAEFVAATRRAVSANFDMVEFHAAHGYLMSSFISPLTNRRSDEYGGSLENRCRYPLEVFRAMREVWPEDKPMSVRISAHDWVAGGNTPDDSVAVASLFKAAGADIIHVSSGQVSKEEAPVYGRMFQVPFSDQIRNELQVPTIAVGNIFEADHVNTIIAAGRADLCALARPHLADPAWTLHAAAEQGVKDIHWPKQYQGGKVQLERNLERAAQLALNA